MEIENGFEIEDSLGLKMGLKMGGRRGAALGRNYLGGFQRTGRMAAATMLT